MAVLNRFLDILPQKTNQKYCIYILSHQQTCSPTNTHSFYNGLHAISKSSTLSWFTSSSLHLRLLCIFWMGW